MLKEIGCTDKVGRQICLDDIILVDCRITPELSNNGIIHYWVGRVIEVERKFFVKIANKYGEGNHYLIEIDAKRPQNYKVLGHSSEYPEIKDLKVTYAVGLPENTKI